MIDWLIDAIYMYDDRSNYPDDPWWLRYLILYLLMCFACFLLYIATVGGN